MKMTFQKGFLVFAVVLINARVGQTIQCYSYECFNLTNTHHPSCAPPKIITCPVDHHSLVLPNRCMTQRITAEIKGTVVQQEIRGCSDNLQCRANKVCDQAKQQDDIKTCETACCEGDLCNREGPVARHIAADPMAPSGNDLSCYACSNATEPGKPPAINCNHPIVQQCGYDPLTNAPQDRCITITMSSKMPGPHGLTTLYQEMRHCSSEHYCVFCKHANMSGTLSSCKATCCYGNMCNSERMAVMTSTLKPLTTVTAVQEDKFARQGAQTDAPTTVKPANTAVSCNYQMFGFKFSLLICILFGLFL